MQDLQANVESVDETIDRYLGVGDIDSAVYWMDSGLKRLLTVIHDYAMIQNTHASVRRTRKGRQSRSITMFG